MDVKDLKDGSIIVSQTTDNNKFNEAIKWLIETIDGSIYGHTALYLGGKFWEYGIFVTNTKVKQGFYEYHLKGDVYEPKKDLTEEEVKKALKFVKKGFKYNIVKYILMMFIYPTRWIWKKLKWVPFNNSASYICSEAIDRLYKYLGYDIIPNELEGYTSPGDLTKSGFFKFVGTIDTFPKKE